MFEIGDIVVTSADVFKAKKGTYGIVYEVNNLSTLVMFSNRKNYIFSIKKDLKKIIKVTNFDIETYFKNEKLNIKIMNKYVSTFKYKIFSDNFLEIALSDKFIKRYELIYRKNKIKNILNA